MVVFTLRDFVDVYSILTVVFVFCWHVFEF